MPENWHARFGKQRRENTGYAVRPYADFTHPPLGGSWLNMAESMQRILVQRALAGQHPKFPDKIISLLEGVAQGWNRNPAPFEWGGKRAARRQRSRARHYALGGSGACTRKLLRRRQTLVDKWQSASQTTH